MKNVEIERKWLMDGFPDLPAASEEIMEQAYLSLGPTTVRIRRQQQAQGTFFWLTIKGQGGLRRTEVELPLSGDQYAALLPLAVTPKAVKLLRRYPLPGGNELECSLVDPDEDCQFYYAEVEFDSEEAAAAFKPPAFLGREVTGEPGYTMAAHCRRKAQGGA